MNNGIVTITGTGDDGIQVSATDDTTDEYNGQVLLNGGTLNVTVSAEDVKAVKCDSAMTITDDAGYSTTVNITCESTAYAAKGLKSGGDMTITGGTFNISTAGKGVWDSDDSSASTCAALKSNGNMVISGGTFTLTATGSGGKGIKADGTLDISGGTVAFYGSSSPECGIDAAEGYNFYVTGGTVLSVGGTSSTPSSTSGSQAYVNVNSSVSANSTISIKSGSTTLASFTVPSTYTSSNSGNMGGMGGMGGPGGGGMGSSSYIMISTPDLVSGKSYTVSSGTSSTTGTATTSGGGRW